tara:strand:+ start:534 stop:1502 length:969 start_codon:yes stop_codon:yes gene_type:complete
MKKAFITGINGQDGSYLTEHLLSMGYEVGGLVRRSSVAENQTYRINHLEKDINTYYGDLIDKSSIDKALKAFKPDYIFNLAAQSHVRLSFDMPSFTARVNSLGALNVFEAVKEICPNAKVYQASSSEMFGSCVDHDNFQRETTPMKPVSPYGCSKLYAYSIARNYRKSYGLFISNGILFNHESPRRGKNFVTAKVVKGALDIKYGKAEKLEMGNLESFRDWGHSSDYTKAMIKLLNHSEPEDIVISTGKAHSVKELCKEVFDALGLNFEDHIVINKKYFRPEELPYLQGDSKKGRELLSWEPEYTFKTLLLDMINEFEKEYI